MLNLVESLSDLQILPVLIINSEEEAVDVATALLAGGVRAVEITLRSSAAVGAIGRVKQAFPAMTVAAGTVLTPEDMRAVADAGADFAVSPGFTPKLSRAASDLKLPFLPGVSSPSEIIAGSECGHNCFKLFPAEMVGGTGLLKALASPFAGIRFCPTGGIGAHNFRDYLALPNVICVGGSWMVSPELIRERRWDRIEALARECSSGVS